MFKRMQLRKTGFSLPDLLAFALLMAIFVSFFAVARYWSGPLSPPEPVDLSFRSLPYAMFLSISRILITYLVCLITSLAIGYWAAHSKLAENIILPLIDIGQSIPVLAFLPGVSIFFLSLFPESRVGLEMGCIVTLYVGMAWNLMLSFYNSIKTIPREYVDIIRAYGYGRLGILLRLELPYAMNGIVWNSMLSVAGGWFFITVCESYTIGDRSYSLVGLGSYMSIAADRGNVAAQVAGIGSMLLVLILADTFIWKPLLRWAERFQRMHGLNQEDEDDEPVLNFFSKSKRITNLLRKVRRRYATRLYVTQRRGRRRRQKTFDWRWAGYLSLALLFLFAAWGLIAGFEMVAGIPLSEWLAMMRAAGLTFLRVTAVLILSSVIMIPLGLWLGSQPRLVKRVQPIIQVIAAFPAPMIFPILMGAFLWLSIPLSIGSIFLMMFGAQWYLLFNVMSGIAGVPPHLVELARTTGMSRFGIIRRVYLPAAFPPILTGLITAAGGAWNVSIVAEVVVVSGGKRYLADGLGSYINESFARAAYPELIAAVAVMVLLIVVVNRLFWARLYDLAETKYRLDG